MPNIPMLNTPGAVTHQRSTVPMSGAPGMDYKLDESRALINFGKAVSGAIGNIADSQVNKMRELEEKQRYTDDRLNAAKARNLYREIQSSVEIQMAENPEMYAEFPDWTNAADIQYQEEVKQYLDKMSPDFRKMFDEEMSGISAETMKKRKMFSIQAGNTARYNTFEALWKDAALRGDHKECERLLTEFSDVLISRNEETTRRLEVNRFAEYGRAERLLKSGDMKVLDDLKATNKDGSYKNYTGLSMKDRATLIKYGDELNAERSYNDNLLLQDRLLKGEIITEEDIENKFAGDSSTAGLKQKHQQLDMVKRFRLLRENAAEKARLSNRKQKSDKDYYDIMFYQFDEDAGSAEEQYAKLHEKIKEEYKGDGPGAEKLLGALEKRYKSYQENGSAADDEYFSRYEFPEDREAAKAQYDLVVGDIEERFDSAERSKYLKVINDRYNMLRQKWVTNDEYRLLTWDFGKDPGRAKEDYLGMKNWILKEYSDDIPTLKRLTSQLDANYNAFNKPEGSYKERYEYKFGVELLNTNRAAFEPATRFLQSMNDDVEEFNFKMIHVSFDEFMRTHPNATTDEVIHFFKEKKKIINEINVNDIIDSWKTKRIQ